MHMPVMQHMGACADTPPAVLQKKAGVAKDLIFADPKAPRFVLWQGRLRPVPSGPGSLLRSELLTTRGKLRALFGALGLRPKPPGKWLPNTASHMQEQRFCMALQEALAWWG